MRKITLFLVLFALVLIIPRVSFSYPFLDDFNDGDLNGWSAKQGVWSNPGDHLLSSVDNYGIIWKDGSFGFDQFLQVDAFFDSGSPLSKTAQLRLRSGNAGSGPNPYFDHGYYALVMNNWVGIYNAVQPFNQQLLGQTSISLSHNSWHTIAFSVTGLGDSTNLKLWIDGVLYLDVFDTQGSQHDDGGYIALGSSNHINRQIKYDNISTDAAYVSKPATVPVVSGGAGIVICVMMLAGIGMAGMKRKLI